MRMYRTNVGMYACSPNSANIQIEGYILDVNVGTHNIFNQMRHGRQCSLHFLYTTHYVHDGSERFAVYNKMQMIQTNVTFFEDRFHAINCIPCSKYHIKAEFDRTQSTKEPIN